MKRRKRLALGIVLLVALALLALPAIVLAGHGSSNAPARSDNAKAGRATPSAESVRVERRESFRHTGCSKRAERRTELGV